MSLKLYKINTTLNHPDCMAGFKKNDDEIFSFFRLDIGNEEKINNTFEIVCQWMDKLLIPKMNELCASE